MSNTRSVGLPSGIEGESVSGLFGLSEANAQSPGSEISSVDTQSPVSTGSSISRTSTQSPLGASSSNGSLTATSSTRSAALDAKSILKKLRRSEQIEHVVKDIAAQIKFKKPELELVRVLMLDADGCFYQPEYQLAMLLFLEENASRLDSAMSTPIEDFRQGYLGTITNEYRQKLKPGFEDIKLSVDDVQVFNSLYIETLDKLDKHARKLLVNQLKQLVLRAGYRWIDGDYAALINDAPSTAAWETAFKQINHLHIQDLNLRQSIKELLTSLTIDKFNSHKQGIESPVQGLVRRYTRFLYEQKSVVMKELCINNNEVLIEFLQRDQINMPAKQVIVRLASQRQSGGLNESNRSNNMTGSFFEDLVDFSSYLDEIYGSVPVVLNRMTMTDIHSKLPHGTTYNDVLMGKKETGSYQWDNHKGSIVYAGAHGAAAENPNANIVAHMVDDKIEIISALHAFYSKHPEMLPHNVTLVLIRYDGNINETFTVKGTGKIDYDYQNSVNDMVNMAHDDARFNYDDPKVYPDFKSIFKPAPVNRPTVIPDIMTTLLKPKKMDKFVVQRLRREALSRAQDKSDIHDAAILLKMNRRLASAHTPESSPAVARRVVLAPSSAAVLSVPLASTAVVPAPETICPAPVTRSVSSGAMVTAPAALSPLTVASARAASCGALPSPAASPVSAFRPTVKHVERAVVIKPMAVNAASSRLSLFAPTGKAAIGQAGVIKAAAQIGNATPTLATQLAVANQTAQAPKLVGMPIVFNDYSPRR